MKPDNIREPTMQALLSLLIMGIGTLIMAFMMYTESEPGALPLLLIMVGAAWYSVIRIRLRSQARTE